MRKLAQYLNYISLILIFTIIIITPLNSSTSNSNQAQGSEAYHSALLHYTANWNYPSTNAGSRDSRVINVTSSSPASSSQNPSKSSNEKEQLAQQKLAKHQSQSNGYILITDLGGDIDDVLTLKMAFMLNKPPSAIIASHHKPLEKAKIAKLIAIRSGHPQIPVFIGDGCTEKDSREEFTTKNPLWPALFGYLNPKPKEKTWHPFQGKAYHDVFGPAFEAASKDLEEMPGHEMLIQAARNTQRLDIVALGPLHDIYNALITIRKQDGEESELNFAKKIKLWSMGGEYPFGYNWLIAPDVSSYVLNRVQTFCISSNFVREMNFIVSPEEFDAYMKASHSDKLTEAIKKDWIYWNKSEKLQAGKFIADPVTLYLYLHQQEITDYVPISVDFPCLDDTGKVKAELIGTAYFTKGMEDKITKFKPTSNSKLTFVNKVKSPEKLRLILMNLIAKMFNVES